MTNKLIGPQDSVVPETKGKNELKSKDGLKEGLTPQLNDRGYLGTYEVPKGRLIHETNGVYIPNILLRDFLGVDGYGGNSLSKADRYKFEGKNANGVPLVSILSSDGKVLAQNVECPEGKATEMKVGGEVVTLIVTEISEVSATIKDITNKDTKK